MRNSFRLLTFVGLLVIAGFFLTERFLVEIPDLIAIPVMLIGIALVIVGSLKGPGKQPAK